MEKQASSSRRQIPSLRPRTLDARPRSCSCCSSPQKAQIHSGSRRRPKPSSNNRLRAGACSSVGLTTTWGAKRARTALDRGSPFDSSSSLPHPNWRDWANLTSGPAGLIAERLLANDVADYLRFRAVCRPWRRCSVDPRAHGGLDGRFRPRRWIMLREELAYPQRRRFLNLSTGERIQIDLPELRDHHLGGCTREGFLLLLHEDTHVIRLLNPLTRVLTDLPSVTTLLSLDDGRYSLDEYSRHCDFGITDEDSSSTVTVVLWFSTLGVLAVAKPGDRCWKKLPVNQREDPPKTTLPFAGRFYCVTRKGVMVLTPGATADQPPTLKLAAKLHMSVIEMTQSTHLVDNGGELLMVHRRLHRRFRWEEWRRCYDVYRVDLVNGRLLPVRSFGGRAVFMGWNFSLSVPTDVFPSISDDTIYLSFSFKERFHEKIQAYHLADGTTTPDDGIMDDGPRSIADCLACCVTV